MTRDDLERAASSMTNKERLVGLIGAPVAAFLTFVVTAALVSGDPSARLRSGRLNPAHVGVSSYHTLEVVLLAVSLSILIASMMRKRLAAAVATALFGLGVFNLHYWGFGMPYVMAGAWLLVRSYRMSQQLKLLPTDDDRAARDRGGRTAVAAAARSIEATS